MRMALNRSNSAVRYLLSLSVLGNLESKMLHTINVCILPGFSIDTIDIDWN